MAPVVIDVKKAEDHRDIVHRAVQALAEGGVVAFPTETYYQMAVSASRSDAVRKLCSLPRPDDPAPVTLAVKSADAALDYVPDISDLGRRLARRCWPGPVTLVLANGHPESLTQRLPADVRQVISPSGQIGLRVPSHPLLLEVLRLTAAPVLLADAAGLNAGAADPAELLAQSPDDVISLILDDGPCRFGQHESVVQVAGNQWALLQAGVLNAERLRWFTNLMVVFVCTGNTCRSPMAEGMFRARAAKRLGCASGQLEDQGLMVLSAGIAAMQGGHSSPESLQVMKSRGIDISQHASQPLTDRLVRFADLILTMTHGHRHAIVNRWPEAGQRVALLCRDDADVGDPIGGPLELYDQCANQIESHLDAWLDVLRLNDLPRSEGE